MNKKILKQIADGLNKLNCTWAIGGSVLLNHYNLVKKPNDIDILIDPNDTAKIKEFMDSIGTPVELPSKEPFRTKVFFDYIVDDTMIEFMGDFKIDLGDNNIYRFVLDKDAIVNKMFVDNTTVYLTSLEDWIVAYKVMNDPKKRVVLLKEYFMKEGIKHKHLLERNLLQDLPKEVKELIIDLLN